MNLCGPAQLLLTERYKRTNDLTREVRKRVERFKALFISLFSETKKILFRAWSFAMLFTTETSFLSLR